MSTRYPKIRQAYAGHALVRALDRVDTLAHSNGMIQLLLVQYLDTLEDALGSGLQMGQSTEPTSLLNRAVEAVNETLEAFGLLESLHN